MHHAGGPVRKGELSYVLEGYKAASGTAQQFAEYLLDQRPRQPGETAIRFKPLSEPKLATFETWTPRADTLEEALRELQAFGLVERQERPFEFGLDKEIYELTPEGRRVAELIVKKRKVFIRAPQREQTHIFIASAFGPATLNHLYEAELAPACLSVGLEPYRADLSEPDAAISPAIVESIANARAMIADLTLARPSVYFEIGLAHGFGVPLLLTCREDHYRSSKDSARVHFDLEQYKISFWRELRGKFRWQRLMKPSLRLAALLSSDVR